jgi:hypothetical protein
MGRSALPSICKHVLGNGLVVVVIDALQHRTIGEFDGDFSVQHIFPPKSFDSRAVVIDELAKTLHEPK